VSISYPLFHVDIENIVIKPKIDNIAKITSSKFVTGTICVEKFLNFIECILATAYKPHINRIIIR